MKHFSVNLQLSCGNSAPAGGQYTKLCSNKEYEYHKFYNELDMIYYMYVSGVVVNNETYIKVVNVFNDRPLNVIDSSDQLEEMGLRLNDILEAVNKCQINRQ